MKTVGVLRFGYGSFYRECELYQAIYIEKKEASNGISIKKNITQVIHPRHISEISEDEVKQIITEVIKTIANDLNEDLINKILCNITDAN